MRAKKAAAGKMRVEVVACVRAAWLDISVDVTRSGSSIDGKIIDGNVDRILFVLYTAPLLW